MYNPIEFGKHVAALRQAARLMQTQAARASGVAPTTWASWEQGRNSPPLAACEKIADVLGVSMVSLLGIYAPTSDPLMLKIAGLDDETRAAVVKIVETMARGNKSSAV